MFSLFFFIVLLFLLGSSALTAIGSALLRQGKLQTEEDLKQEQSPFFFRYFLNFFFGKQKWDGLLFSISFTKHLLRIGFVFSAFLLLLGYPFFGGSLSHASSSNLLVDRAHLIGMIGTIVATSLIFDFGFGILGKSFPKLSLRLLAAFSSLLLLICTPLTAPFFRLMKLLLPKVDKQKKLPPNFRIRDKVFELLQETELGTYLDANEQKLILSVVSFKERIAREVMVPRINLFSVSAESTVQEAAHSFLSEGYSRIPIYKDSVDNIIGVLLHKDVLKLYIEQENSPHKLHQPVEKFLKPVLYTPETKKISQLLQEFRSKQIHLAIVVDEWGGTEGIVTIEDILEELVGEIADEYDVEQQLLYTTLPGGGWVVDSKMTIIDIREDLGVKIPYSPEYDTIGGYIFDRAGAIPSKGWKIHHDDFDLEVMSSSERAVEKIKIIPL